MNLLEFEGRVPLAGDRRAVLAPWGSLSEPLRDAAVLHLADTLGVMIAGARLGIAPKLQALVGSASLSGQSGLIGTRLRADSMTAALVNATVAHGTEFDDAHEFLHPGSPVVAACVAVAEACGAAGVDLLRGVVAGYGVSARLAQAAGNQHRMLGFHPTGTCNAVGAAVGACLVMGGTQEQLRQAMNIGVTGAAGLSQYHVGGGCTKQLNAGFAARTGVTAANLAMLGLEAAPDSITGEYGFLNAMTGRGSGVGNWAGEGSWATDQLETAILETYCKPFPCCGRSHSSVATAIELHGELTSSGRRPEDIKAVTVETFARACEPWLIMHRDPRSTVEAMLNLPVCVALALVDGQLTLESLEPQSFSRPSVRSVAELVSVEENPEFTGRQPSSAATRVTLEVADGSLSAETDIGGVGRGVDRSRLKAKFLTLVRPSIGEGPGSQLWETILRTAEQSSVSEIVSLACPVGSRAAAGQPRGVSRGRAAGVEPVDA